jgi:hypothetical protein
MVGIGSTTMPSAAKTIIGVPMPVTIFALLAQKEVNNVLMWITHNFVIDLYYEASIRPCAENFIRI